MDHNTSSETREELLKEMEHVRPNLKYGYNQCIKSSGKDSCDLQGIKLDLLEHEASSVKDFCIG